jgi:hypothetical protein
VEFPEFIVIVDFLRRASTDPSVLDRLRNAFTQAKKFASKEASSQSDTPLQNVSSFF